MTKEQFLQGKSFSLGYCYGADTTYKYQTSDAKYDSGSIVREYRSKEGIVVLSDHILNVEKIGTKRLKAFTFILDSKIVKTIYFNDMVYYGKVPFNIPEPVNS